MTRTGKEDLERLRNGLNASVPGMADILGWHPNTVWKAIRDGKIAAVRAGRLISIPNYEGRRLAGLPSAEPMAA